jgi:mono/diheme cytochrome c family protein
MTRPFFIGLLLSTLSLAGPATSAPSSAPAPVPTTQPVPLLSSEDEAKTFVLPPGFRAEVVAAEPMVQHPVAMAFDPDGKLYVAEMRGYMPDVDGWGENKPTGRISILEDTDGDGRMDKSTVFLDKIVLPRAVGFANGGVLVGTPPKLLFCRDLNGDGRCDTTELLANDFGVIENPENSANGLLWNLDNWIYDANYTKRFRFEDGKFVTAPIPDLGQFGISRDDYGRLFFNTNSDHLRGSMVPPGYSSRNPKSPMAIADMQVAKDQTVWPSHAATVNRGYREGFLRDGRLAAFTAACSPCIYRATLFPPEFYGNAFTCEPTSNLVHRDVISESDALLSAKSPYDGKEFLTSTYERFRPVNLSVGPEGALYIVDMHHGLLQHRISITDYAKSEYLKKQLNKHLLTGRIFRIVPDDGAAHVARPRLNQASTAQLVMQLTHPSAWWRETAQRMLVERRDPDAVAPLKKMALGDGDSVHRLDALWTLDGMKKLDADTLAAALADGDSKVRANAVRLAEPFIEAKPVDPKIGAAYEKLGADPSADVRLQLVLSTSSNWRALAEIMRDSGESASLREALVSGLAGREIEFLTMLLADPDWKDRSVGRAKVIADVARSITRRDEPHDVERLVEMIGAQRAENRWQQIALLEAIPPARKDDFGAAKPIVAATQPAAIAMLRSASDPKLSAGADRIAALFEWPGKPVPPRPKLVPLSEKQQALFAVGEKQYTLICAQCHKPDGSGQDGKAPPLLNSPWVLGPQSRAIRIVLHGMRGPIPVGEKTFNLDMPSLKALSDEQIAGVLTYIRRSFGHEADPIEPAAVQSVRDWTQARRDGWTVPELLEMK